MQLFIARTTLDPQIRAVDKSVIETRRVNGGCCVNQACRNDGRGIGPLPGSGKAYGTRAGSILMMPCGTSSLWLVPSPDLSTRASVWSLLWGEQQELTQQWLNSPSAASNQPCQRTCGAVESAGGQLWSTLRRLSYSRGVYRAGSTGTLLHPVKTASCLTPLACQLMYWHL